MDISYAPPAAIPMMNEQQIQGAGILRASAASPWMTSPWRALDFMHNLPSYSMQTPQYNPNQNIGMYYPPGMMNPVFNGSYGQGYAQGTGGGSLGQGSGQGGGQGTGQPMQGTIPQSNGFAGQGQQPQPPQPTGAGMTPGVPQMPPQGMPQMPPPTYTGYPQPFQGLYGLGNLNYGAPGTQTRSDMVFGTGPRPLTNLVPGNGLGPLQRPQQPQGTSATVSGSAPTAEQKKKKEK